MAKYFLSFFVVVALSARLIEGYLDLDYHPVNEHDPELVVKVREALTTLGINPNGIRVLAAHVKDWGIGTSYKVTYLDADGKQCYIHFRDKMFVGIGVQGVPACDQRSIGNEGGPSDSGFPPGKGKITIRVAPNGGEDDVLMQSPADK